MTVSPSLVRVEYDAYRVDLEWAGQQGGDTGLLAEARRQHDLRLAEYQRLREKVTVKLTLLDENRVGWSRSAPLGSYVGRSRRI